MDIRVTDEVAALLVEEAERRHVKVDELVTELVVRGVKQARVRRRLLFAAPSLVGGAVAAISGVLPWYSTAFIPRTFDAFELGNNGQFSVGGIFIVALGLLAVLIGFMSMARTFPSFLRLIPAWTGIGVGVDAVFALSAINS